MATVTKWSNVAIAMQSALASPKTITAISLANPGVASSTSHGYSNGDYVLLSAQGMYQVDSKVVRVASVATDTFALEGVDTTLFSAFSSGTAKKITFGTSITTALTMSTSGGTFAFLDTTTIHVNAKSQVPGLPDAATFTFDNIWDPTDAGQIAMKAATDSQSAAAFRFTFGSGGKIMCFNGYVGFSGIPGGTAQDKVTTQAVITQTAGSATFYAS
jgi:hypothetical protein